MAVIAQDLPDDILRDLFDYLATIDPAGFIPHYTKPYFSLGWIATTTHVCRQWRSTALDMPALWADVVTVFPSTSTADGLLARARDCLLKIEVCHSQRPDDPVPARYHTPVHWSARHLDRAHTFYCDVHSWSEFVRDDADTYRALTGPLPSLRTLDLLCKDDAAGYLPLLQVNAPNLEEAVLSGVLLHPSSHAPNLRTLLLNQYKLESSSWDALPPILDTTRGFPNLDYLNLNISSMSSTTPLVADRPNSKTLHLDRLTTLYATLRHEHHVLDLLDLISAPLLTSTSFDLYKESFDWERLFTKAVDAHQQLLHIEDLTISEEHLSITGRSSTSEPVELDLKWYSPDSHYRHYDSIIASVPRSSLNRYLPGVTSVEIECLKRGHHHEELDIALAALCDALVSVERLTIVDAAHPTTLRMLLAPVEGTMVLPMPNLKILSLDMDGEYNGKSASSCEEHYYSDAGYTHPISWWDTLKSVLQGRLSHAGAPLQTLKLAGHSWCSREEWTREWTDVSKECLERGLVGEVVDVRRVGAGCRMCR